MENAAPVVMNIYYWQINTETGQSANPINETKVLESVAYLNIEFNQYNIYFKYRGFDSFNSPSGTTNSDGTPDTDGWSSLDVSQISSMMNWAKNNGKYKEDAINAYVPSSNTGFAGAAFTIGTNRITMPPSNLTSPIMHHEMGHALGLIHTWSGYTGNSCEHVTRNPNDANYNADTRADQVTDTAAVPSFFTEYCHFNDLPTSDCFSGEFSHYYTNLDTCTYEGANNDCEGSQFIISQEDVQNYMASVNSVCRARFSTGQVIRMQERVMSDSDLVPTQTPLSSLYEPYKGSYYNAGPAIDPARKAVFQPGFDYVFYTFDGFYPQPSDYDDISFSYTTPQIKAISKFETDYSSIVHDNHTAFVIKGLGDIVQPRKCYNNYNRSTPRGGRVTRFNDNTFNQNTTTENKNEQEINDDQLINHLEPGLYMIEKEYDGGVKEETVISKNNN